jgi:hypothetical protein
VVSSFKKQALSCVLSAQPTQSGRARHSSQHRVTFKLGSCISLMLWPPKPVLFKIAEHLGSGFAVAQSNSAFSASIINQRAADSMPLTLLHPLAQT